MKIVNSHEIKGHTAAGGRLTRILLDHEVGLEDAAVVQVDFAEGIPRSRVLLDTRLIHDSWRKGCRDERTKARGGFGGGRPQGERSQGPRASQ